MIIHLIVGLIKNMLLHKMSYFPQPYTHGKKNSNYATKSDLKSAAGVDTSKVVKKADF